MGDVVRRRGTRYGNGAGRGGPRKGPGVGPASGIPAKGSWDDFAEGNEAGKTHGASMERYYAPVAEVVLSELLTDSNCPDYLKSPVMRWSLRGWAVAEAKCVLLSDYVESLPLEQQVTAKKQGQTAPIEIWVKLEKHAANQRARLGLDPVSKVRIGKALTSTGLDLAQLAMKYSAAELGELGDGE